MEKVVFVVCDGISDRLIPEFGRKTPLEAAYTPNLDKLAQKGICGMVDVIDVGIRPGSDVAHLSILGYNPDDYYTGRGPFEVAGLDMKLQPGDVAFRANAGTVDKNLVIVDRRAGRIDDTSPLAELLNGVRIEKVEFLLKPGTAYRLGLIMRGNGLSDQITDPDPHEIGVEVLQAKPKDRSKEAKKTAEILNKFLELAYQKLKELPLNQDREKQGLLPANYIMVRGAGMAPKIPSFEKKYGLNACCLAGAGLYKGVGRLLGMEVIDVPGATGKPDSKVENKIKKLIEVLDQFDFFFVHIKGADSLAEDGDFKGKKKFIEKIDWAIGPLLNLKDVLIVVTADHSTACSLKIHTGDSVPVLMVSSQVREDDVTSFGERSCAKGGLGHIKGLNLMPMIINLLGVSELVGA